MKVWIVMDGDYDGDWVVGVYDNEAAALAHEAAEFTHKPEIHEVRLQFEKPVSHTETSQP